MVISVSPVIITLIIIVLGNCIISFGKSKLLNRCYIVLSSIFSVAGMAGIFLIRPHLLESLNRKANTGNIDSDFVSWAIEKFDSFAVVSIPPNSAVILFLLFLLVLNKNKTGFIWTNTTIIIISMMAINFIAGICYGFGTINVLFDLAGYISQLTAFEFFVLHIPLVIKRILVCKK